jgi:tetratricopeptide (TPR) repeat protein
MNAQELYDKGFDLRCSGAYGEARSVLQQVLGIEPDHADARWQLGLIEGFEGDFDGSIATLTKLVEEHPDHVNARYDLAMTLMMLGMDDEACAQFKEVLRRKPDHEKALQQIVYCQ